MPRFFFDTDDGSHRHRDEDGHALVDPGAARHMALECLPDMARDKLTKDGDRRDFTVDVRDETGRVVYTACLFLLARWFVEPGRE